MLVVLNNFSHLGAHISFSVNSVCHTTRKRQAEEIHGKDYKFVSIEEFEELIKLGCFIQTNMYNAQWYGLSMDSIESIAAEGLATVVNMELEVWPQKYI